MVRRQFIPPAATWERLADDFEALAEAPSLTALESGFEPLEVRAAKLLSCALEAGAVLPGVELGRERMKKLRREMDAAEAVLGHELRYRPTGLSIDGNKATNVDADAIVENAIFFASLAWFACVTQLGELYPDAFSDDVKVAFKPPGNHWPEEERRDSWAVQARVMGDACRLIPSLLRRDGGEALKNTATRTRTSGYVSHASNQKRRVGRRSLEFEAIQVKHENPAWNNRQVAKAIGRDPSFLSRSELYTTFCKRLKSGRIPRGFMRRLADGSVDVEAIDD